jgi:hypothetical protein
MPLSDLRPSGPILLQNGEIIHIRLPAEELRSNPDLGVMRFSFLADQPLSFGFSIDQTGINGHQVITGAQNFANSVLVPRWAKFLVFGNASGVPAYLSFDMESTLSDFSQYL